MFSVFNRGPEHERLVFMLRHQSIFINENTFCQCGIINEVACFEHFIYKCIYQPYPDAKQ